MTATLTIPTPPAWIDLDSVIDPELRRNVFAAAARIDAAEDLPVEELLNAADLYEAVYKAESHALANNGADSTVEPGMASEGLLHVLQMYGGTQAISNALGRYVQEHPELRDTRIDPDRYLAVEPKPIPSP